MGAEQLVDPAAVIEKRVGDVEMGGGLVGRLQLFRIGPDFAQGGGQAGRIARQLGRTGIGQELALARDGQPNERGDKGRQDGQQKADDDQGRAGALVLGGPLDPAAP